MFGERSHRIKTRLVARVESALLTLALLFVIALLSGCRGFFTDANLTSITVSPTTATVGVGSTQQLTATGNFDDGSTSTLSGSDVTWSSSSTSVATVDANGVVTGVATGTATITATSQGFTSTATITVSTSSITSIAVSPTSAVLTSGGTTSFVATATLADNTTTDVTNQVTWKSSNPAAATINTSGVATAQTVTSTQTTNITATSGSITSNAAVVTVNP